MADRFDVAGRLAEGRPAMERTHLYVQACHELGYQQPELTAHPSQVRDSYDAESSLDLTLLDGDCAALRAAVDAVEQALWVQREHVTEFATTWRGAGADSATRFLQRHCDTATQVVARVRSAAEVCAALRDSLWQAVDGKVATTVAIDERRTAQRAAWLAAAHTVTAGAADRSAAEELIRREVIPYVDNDIGNAWLSAVHSAALSMATSYDTAIHALTSAPELGFDVPGDLGPRWQPAFDAPQHAIAAVPAPSDFAMPVGPAPTAPAAAQPPPPSGVAEPHPLSAENSDGAETPLGDIGGLSSGAGGLGGLGGMGGGIGGVIESIVDGIGSLIGSLAGGLGDASGAGDPLLDDPVEARDVEGSDPAVDDDHDEAADDDGVADADTPVAPAEVAEPPAEAPSAAAEVVDGSASPPPMEPPVADQTAPAAPQPADGATPCEIAEDQLPQAGQ